MSLIKRVQNKADELNLNIKIEPPTQKGKKLSAVILDTGKRVNFGDINSQTFIEGANQKKRSSYRSRASKIKNKDGQFTYKIKYTPNFLSYHLLW